MLAAVGPAARTEGLADVVARAVEPGRVAPFDFDTDGATEAERVGVTDAWAVAVGVEECRGVDEGVLVGGG